jgi:hypothetical protein
VDKSQPEAENAASYSRLRFQLQADPQKLSKMENNYPGAWSGSVQNKDVSVIYWKKL